LIERKEQYIILQQQQQSAGWDMIQWKCVRLWK